MPTLQQMGRRVAGQHAEPLRVVRAEGSHVWDAHGKRHTDFLMGWCVGNLGWAHPELRAAAQAFDGPDYVYPRHQYGPWAELAEGLVRAAPGDLAVCYRATGGTEAVEIALQLAMAATGRHRIASLEGAYHGNSVATRAAAHGEDAKQFGRVLPGPSIKPPLNGRALRRVETALRGRDVAAFLMEPVSCNLGVLLPSQEFMDGLRRLCDRTGTLLILDEVACGFGRTGKLFASEHFGAEPDLLCLGKALTGGHAPMGATLATREVADAAGGLSFYSTYGWHPLSTAVALANLRHWKAHHGRLLRNVAQRSAQVQDRLLATFDEDAVRAKGLAIAVKLEGEDATSRMARRCGKEGLLLAHEGETLQLFPALNLDEATATAGLDILERCAR
jgi:acetylornithine/succinyldiaminopimelate/putrescine aminotransferase